MAYIALKPCRFDGVNYYIGDAIPTEAFDKASLTRLVSLGYVVDAGQSTENRTEMRADNPQNYAHPVENVDIPVIDGETVNTIPVSVSSLTDFFVGMQKSAGDVVELVEAETRTDLLNLLKYVDTRKTVKAAAEKRLAELAGDGE